MACDYTIKTFSLRETIVTEYVERWLVDSGLIERIIATGSRTGSSSDVIGREIADHIVRTFASELTSLNADDKADRFEQAIQLWSYRVQKRLDGWDGAAVENCVLMPLRLWDGLLGEYAAALEAIQPFDIGAVRRPKQAPADEARQRAQAPEDFDPRPMRRAKKAETSDG